MKQLIYLLIGVMFLSCKPTQSTTENRSKNSTEQDTNLETSSPSGFKEISFTTLAEGNNGGFLEQKNVVVKSEEKLQEIWNEAYSNFMKKPPLPKINFETSVVVLVAIGERNNGGFSVKVASVTEHENNLMIIAEENIPNDNCVTTSMISYPYEIIEFPVTHKKIVFKNVEKIYDCEE